MSIGWKYKEKKHLDIFSLIYSISRIEVMHFKKKAIE